MVNSKKSIIKFQQILIFAVNEVAVALLKPGVSNDKSESIMLSPIITVQVSGDARENFKNRLENYLRIIRVQSNVLKDEPDLTAIKKTQQDAAVDLCASVDDLWRSSLA
jgi:hypothetical protein